MLDSEPTLRSPATWLAVLISLALFFFCTALGVSSAISIPLAGILAGILGPRFHHARSRRESGE
ncbi:MAG: hypothetical protein HZA32_05245 [Opitutae bacterium]|nr:hypothetical protein [Opitutae bacterium]